MHERFIFTDEERRMLGIDGLTPTWPISRSYDLLKIAQERQENASDIDTSDTQYADRQRALQYRERLIAVTAGIIDQVSPLVQDALSTEAELFLMKRGDK